MQVFCFDGGNTRNLCVDRGQLIVMIGVEDVVNVEVHADLVMAENINDVARDVQRNWGMVDELGFGIHRSDNRALIGNQWGGDANFLRIGQCRGVHPSGGNHDFYVGLVDKVLEQAHRGSRDIQVVINNGAIEIESDEFNGLSCVCFWC